MLKLLVKKQLNEIFRQYFYNAKSNQKRSVGATVAFFVLFGLLMYGFLGGMFTLLSVMLCMSLPMEELGWFYFAFMGLIGVMFGTFGSVFNTFSTLYISKDNDLLLSLPIPVKYIMLSRLLSVYIMGLMYSSIATLPAAVVYLILGKFSPLSVVGALLNILLVSLIVFVLSCLLGWVVAKISLRLKRKSIMVTLISLLCMVAYYLVCFKAEDILSGLLAGIINFNEKIKLYAYPLYVLGRAGQGKPLAMLASATVVFALLALTWYLMSRSFVKIVTSSGNTARVNSSGRRLRQGTPFKALLFKELKRFTASSAYMLNCGMGIFLLPLCGVLLLVKGKSLIAELSLIIENSGLLYSFVVATVIAICSLLNTAAPSLSLEGKHIWILKALPIDPFIPFKAKITMQFILTAPAILFFVICAIIVLPFDFISALLTVVASLVYALFAATFAMLLGFKLPNLNWTNEITPIKQGAAVGIAMISHYLISALFCLFQLFVGSIIGIIPCLLISIVIFSAAAFLMYRYIKSNSSRVLLSL